MLVSVSTTISPSDPFDQNRVGQREANGDVDAVGDLDHFLPELSGVRAELLTAGKFLRKDGITGRQPRQGDQNDHGAEVSTHHEASFGPFQPRRLSAKGATLHNCLN